MRFGVISDIHGNHQALSLAVSCLMKLKTDTLLVSGDIALSRTEEIAHLFSRLPWKILAVRGNCDFEEDSLTLGFSLPAFRKVTFGTRTILISHGHLSINPKSAGLSHGDIFITGHTHVPVLEQTPEGIIIVNPGALAEPRGSSTLSFGFITEEEIRVINLISGKNILQRKLT